VESTIVAWLIVTHKPLMLCGCESIMSSKFRTIRIKQDHVVAVPLCAHFVVRVRFVWVKVEDEKKYSFFENYDFIIFMCLSNKLVFCRQ